MFLLPLLALAGLTLLWPGAAASIDWTAGGEANGEWLSTPYSTGTPNECNAAAGEICMEWCLVGPGGGPTGDLCCVSNGACQARDLRLD